MDIDNATAIIERTITALTRGTDTVYVDEHPTVPGHIYQVRTADGAVIEISIIDITGLMGEVPPVDPGEVTPRDRGQDEDLHQTNTNQEITIGDAARVAHMIREAHPLNR